MEILVNEKKITLPKHSNVQDLINYLRYQNQRIAVEINESIIPKSNDSSFKLHDKDQIEIIKAVGGG